MSKDHCSFLMLWRLTNLLVLSKFKADKCQGVGSSLGVLKDISPWRESQEKSFGFLYCVEKSWRRQKRLINWAKCNSKKKIPLVHFLFSEWKKKNIIWSAVLIDPCDSGWEICLRQRWGVYFALSERALHLSFTVPQSLIKSSLSILGKKRTGHLFKQSNFSALGVI